MMALPLLRVALAEPTQNSRLQIGEKPQRPYLRTPSLIRVHIHGIKDQRINELLGETDWRSSPIRRPGEGRAGFCTYAAGAGRQAQLRQRMPLR